MGNRLSKKASQNECGLSNKQIERAMKQAIEEENNRRSVVVLGSNAVGKTTMCKSILSSYVDDFEDYMKSNFANTGTTEDPFRDVKEITRNQCCKEVYQMLTVIGWTEQKQNSNFHHNDPNTFTYRVRFVYVYFLSNKCKQFDL